MPLPRAILSWTLTPFYIVFFFGILLCFHPLLVVANLFGYTAHKRVLEIMNIFLITNFRLMGTRISVTFKTALPTDRPLVFVSNHQSMYDIPFLVWHLRRFHPKFIAKRELSKGLPSISFALRHMGSVLIDRSNPAQAISAIREFGKYIEKNHYSACIFPEGTRARDGKMKAFKPAGMLALLETIPNALIVPASICGSWELVRYKLLPVPFGVRVRITFLEPFARPETSDTAFVEKVEAIVRAEVERVNS